MSEPMETVDPIKIFWGNLEYSLNESAFKYILDDLVGEMRKSLDDSSKTAQAIDQELPLDEIAKRAKEDGLEDFAHALRFSEP